MQQFKPAQLFDAGGDLSQRWYVFFYFRSPDTRKFVRFRYWVTSRILTATGRRDRAHQMIKALNSKLNKGFNPFTHQEKKYNSIVIALQYFLSIKENICRKRTLYTYRCFIEIFTQWLKKRKIEHMPIDDFNYYYAQEFMDYTMATLKNNHRTHNNRLTAMKTIFKLLVKREWIFANPFDNVDRLPEEDPLIKSFTRNELIIMQDKLPNWNYDLYVCACLIFYCFIRPQELVRLTVSNFNLVKQMIIIPGKASKNKKQEVVNIPNALLPVLQKLDMDCPGDYFMFSLNQKRGPIEYAPTRMAEAWREFAIKHGIEKNLYSLKHTGVGMAIENGINIRDLQLQLRHHNLEMTQIYLDKFNNRPSENLTANFPDLARLAKSNGPVRLPLPAHIYTPGQS